MIPLHETAFDQTTQGKSKHSRKLLTRPTTAAPQAETINNIAAPLASTQKYE